MYRFPHTITARAANLCLLALVFALAALPLQAQLTMLQTSGRNIVDGNGNVVHLQGVNLGGLFVMENWMTPLDTNQLTDNYALITTLDQRFTVAGERALLRTYQENWVSNADLQNIKNAGFNCIRVPVWWGQFYDIDNATGSGWRSDAFDELDRIVDTAGSLGLYVIIDMHGAVGGQSASDSTGRAGLNTYWTDGNNQGNTAWMWWKIAGHYNGNPTIAAYDLLNEPGGASPNVVISAYDQLYKSVRGADTSHIIIMEGTMGALASWSWSELPNPSSYGWANVVYETHEYAQGTGQEPPTEAQVEQGAVNQVNGYNALSYNVPGYIGEFNDYSYPYPDGTQAPTIAETSKLWNSSISQFNATGLSWTMWSYKAIHGSGSDSWGFYNPINRLTFPIPNISSDSYDTIAGDWAATNTATSFSYNTYLGVSGNYNSASMSTSAWSTIINQNSGDCLDATGWGTANGTTIQQWTCGANHYNQQWQFVSVGNGIYKIINRNAPALSWNVVNYGTANSSPLQLWNYGGGTNEQWRAISLGGNLYKFVGVGSGRCLDVPAASTATGVQLQIYDCNGTPAQAFTLTQQ
jgi:hypothetical protein